MRNFLHEQAVSQVAENLGLPKQFVNRVYRSYWRVVREHISQLPLKDDLTDEEFAKLQPNVNIPSIGKLYVNPDKRKWYKEKFEYIKQLKEQREEDVEDNED